MPGPLDKRLRVLEAARRRDEENRPADLNEQIRAAVWRTFPEDAVANVAVALPAMGCKREATLAELAVKAEFEKRCQALEATGELWTEFPYAELPARCRSLVLLSAAAQMVLEVSFVVPAPSEDPLPDSRNEEISRRRSS